MVADRPEFTLDAPVVAPAAVDRVERRLGVRLPSSYRQVLETVGNGGRIRSPDPLGFSEMVGLDGLFGVERDDWYDLEDQLRRMGERIPEGLIPFGESPGGNLVCWSARSDDGGSVWCWDHEYELAGTAVSRIADSISTFFAALANPPSDPAVAPRVRSVKIRDPEFHQRVLDEQRARRAADSSDRKE